MPVGNKHGCVVWIVECIMRCMSYMTIVQSILLALHYHLAHASNAAVAVAGRSDGDARCASRAFTIDSAPQSRVQPQSRAQL